MSLKDLYLETMRLADSRRLDEFLDRFTDDCEWVAPGARLRGREEIREWVGPFWAGFSSFRHTIDRLVEEGDTVVAEGTWTGVHDGVMTTPMGDLPPTGQEVTFPFAMLASGEPAARRASSVHIYFDQLELLGRLGVLPAPETAAA